jgi:hypothetical protein
MADMADAPGGRSLAFTARSLQLLTKNHARQTGGGEASIAKA